MCTRLVMLSLSQPQADTGRRAPAERGPPPSHGDVVTVMRLPFVRRCGYRGGNCELGTGLARLAVGAWLVKPITAQLMSTPTEP